MNAAPFFASISIFLLNSYYNSSYNTFLENRYVGIQ